MKFLLPLAAAALLVALAGCCPGSMLGSMPAPAAPPHAAMAAHPVDSDGDGVPDALDKCPDTPHGVAVNADGCSADQLAALAAAAQPAPAAPAPAPAAPAPEPAAAAPAPAAPSPPSAEQELATHGSIRLENVYFQTNSARLTPASNAPLDEAGAALEKFPGLKVEVEGHTDSRGVPAHNLRLSQARAETVRHYLLAHFHLEPDQLVAKGYGSSQAETKGRTAADLRRDRRVVLRVLNPEALPQNVEVSH